MPKSSRVSGAFKAASGPASLLSAGYVARHRLEQDHASLLRVRLQRHGFQLAPGVGAIVADLIVDGSSETPIESFSIERFAGGVTPDEKLWSEFDPELVATFRQTRQEAGNA